MTHTPAPDPAAEPSPVPDCSGPLFVVFNLASGHGDAQQARDAIETACARSGRALKITAVPRPSELPTLAQQAVAQALRAGGVVVAAGGDGTLNAVAQATLGSGCAFGVLPQGTFNYFGRSHGIPSDTAQAMQGLLHGRVQPVQVGLVNERLFLVNASLGLYPRLLQDREQWKQQLGRSRVVAFLAGLMSLLRGHRSLNLRIELDGHSHQVRTPTLFVGNNRLQMEQLLPERVADIDAGRLAALMLRPVGSLAMLGLALQGALGQLGEADALCHFAFKRLTVGPARRLGARHIKVATDGEIIRLRLPLVFQVSPQPLMLVLPAQAAA